MAEAIPASIPTSGSLTISRTKWIFYYDMGKKCPELLVLVPQNTFSNTSCDTTPCGLHHTRETPREQKNKLQEHNCLECTYRHSTLRRGLQNLTKTTSTCCLATCNTSSLIAIIVVLTKNTHTQSPTQLDTRASPTIQPRPLWALETSTLQQSFSFMNMSDACYQPTFSTASAKSPNTKNCSTMLQHLWPCK